MSRTSSDNFVLTRSEINIIANVIYSHLRIFKKLKQAEENCDWMTDYYYLLLLYCSFIEHRKHDRE